MIYSKLDLFSSQFQFGIGSKQKKKGTLFGTILSSVVVITTFSYFIYILKLYISNEIDPNFKTQSFITEGQIDMDMDNNYVGFQFKYGIQPNQNQTYFQYYAFYYLQDQSNYTMIPLNIIDCTSPSLAGFLCLDFSNITDHKLSLNTKGNSGSQLYIFTYRCIDTDQVKTTVPDNCASETDINNMINNINSGIEFKLFTSQYNTTSQQIQVNYRNAFINPLSSQQVLTYLKSQKQITSIQQGAFIQSSTSFSSPISHSQQFQTLDRLQAQQEVGIGAFSCAFIFPDEIVQYIKIQYLSLPQVLAQIYTIFTLLMFLGVFGRSISKQVMNSELLMVFFKNLYLENYLQILKSNNISNEEPLQQQPTQQLQQEQQTNLKNDEYKIEEKKGGEKVYDENQEFDANSQVIVPSFRSKQKSQLDYDFSYNLQSSQSNSNNPQELVKIQDSLTSSQSQIRSVQCKFNSGQQNPNIYINNQEQNLNIIFDSIVEPESCKSQVSQQNEPIQTESQKLFLSPLNKKAKCYFKKVDLQHKDQSENKKEEENNQKNYKNQILTIHSTQFSNKVKPLISNLNLPCRKKLQKTINGLKPEERNQIEEQIENDMDILNFYQDLLFLKKAIMLLLTEDQLASLQLVGCSKQFLQFDFKNQDVGWNNSEKLKSLTPFEVQFAIYQSKILQQNYCNKFIQRCANNKQLGVLDKKILLSIQKTMNC
ncbi:transmembrane protein, putative (macronuclear) [Tetrahymena thermophila SB210]|uniref:Transmembrane protein, putative n=1 Tax=Tetrahymena thermophila (strain SB210) TaxID=312017 RepID=Q23MQ6_TETTS|nr:transmembrane protein, putative [Tetrahymena thermophila SB210]EAR97786.2 transmembrane protein, putative [Tetrahymena thermophila SB210]|eukprot:XP_001018031.2 transmembrane protein, putative [Tetrahymena thermophila SB210]